LNKLLRTSLIFLTFVIGLLVDLSGQPRTDIMTGSITDVVQKLAVPQAHAGRFGAIPVQSANGRIIPLNTFSSEILRKLHQNTRFGQLNADQFLISLLALPEMWMRIPLITCSNETISAFYDLPANKYAYLDMFYEDGTYKLQQKLNEVYRKAPIERTGFDKELIKLDEKVNILHQLFSYQLIRLFPKKDDPDQFWFAPGDDLSVFSSHDSSFIANVFDWYLSEVKEALKSGNWSNADETLKKITTYQTANNNIPGLNVQVISLELKYNKLEIFRWCKIGYLSLGGLLLLCSFISLFGINPRNKKIGTLNNSHRHAELVSKSPHFQEIAGHTRNDGNATNRVFSSPLMVNILGVCILIIFLFHMTGIAMRWKIGGYAPWSNSYETMVFMAWVVVLAGWVFVRRSPVTLALATLFAGIILFVSGLNWMDPQINPLVPVLKSPWLMFHVAILMAAYGFFGISCLIGLCNLLLMALLRNNHYTGVIRELSLINEISLNFGLILMTIGTFMGAVWANESWGRYWGWDPKETWALITMIVYAMVTHLHLLRKWDNMWLLNLCSVVAFASVLMTYFGVNYLLSGMHSYGQNDHLSGIFAYLCGAGIAILLIAVKAKKKSAKNQIHLT